VNFFDTNAVQRIFRLVAIIGSYVQQRIRTTLPIYAHQNFWFGLVEDIGINIDEFEGVPQPRVW
jgi:hypothetical protein